MDLLDIREKQHNNAIYINGARLISLLSFAQEELYLHTIEELIFFIKLLYSYC